MNSGEESIVKFLTAQWQEGLRITTIPQALKMLGVSDDAETRWRIGQRLERGWRRRVGLRALWRGLRWVRGADWGKMLAPLATVRRLPSLLAEARAWNPTVYMHSNDEKLVARHILRLGRVAPTGGHRGWSWRASC